MAAYRKSLHKSLLTIAEMAVLYWLGDGTVRTGPSYETPPSFLALFGTD